MANVIDGLNAQKEDDNMVHAIILKFDLPQAQHKPNFKTTHIPFR